MSTLAFVSDGQVFFGVVLTLVLGALAWRLIWAILVTPRLDRLPGRTRDAEPMERAPRVRVLVREPEPTIEFIEPQPQIDLIEVITPAKALPSASRSVVRRVQR